MGGRRLQTDLGPISLALVEARSSQIDFASLADANDVSHLDYLLKTGNKPKENSATQIIFFEGSSEISGRTDFQFYEMLKRLKCLLVDVALSEEIHIEKSAEFKFDLEFFGEINISIESDAKKIAFTICLNKNSSKQFLEMEIHNLSLILCGRLGKYVSIKIEDQGN